MLIALTIFGMLTAAGVALLSVSARTQETSDRLLAEFGQVRRLSALLSADLGQAAAHQRGVTVQPGAVGTQQFIDADRHDNAVDRR